MKNQSQTDNPLEWRFIEGFPSYEVSNIGTIRAVFGRGIDQGDVRYIKGSIGSSGYRVVTLRHCLGDHKTVFVHRLVARAFIGERPYGYYIDHKDGNKHNNRAENLRYVTCSENSLKTYREDGYMAPKRGRVRLTRANVNAILRSRESDSVLAKQFGVSIGAINDVRNGRTHVGKTYQKLSDDQVRDIRKDSRKFADIAAEYGVSRTSVSQIKSRKQRPYVEDY